MAETVTIGPATALTFTGAGQTRPALKPPPPPTKLRCSSCFSELFEADRGFGSIALACPKHNFERTILEIPTYVEDYARRNPDVARDYMEFLLEGVE